MGVPYTFATATTSIPLSELDANFNTPVTIGTSTVGLGNTTTSLVGLSNVSTTTVGSTGSLAIQSSSITAITIDTSQNVGIGTTSPASIGSGRILDIAAGSGGNANLFLHGNATTGSAAGLQFQQDGSGNAYMWNYSNGYTVFATNNAERMRIDAGGLVRIGNSSGGNGVKLQVHGDTSPDSLCSFRDTRSDGASGVPMMYFQRTSGTVGSITTTTTSTAYNTNSDYRLKENVVPMTGALETIAQLNPVTYDWISDKSKGQGFIAHELQAIVPDCVTGEKDAVDSEGNPVYQGIDTSFLVATLTAAIQELNATLTTQATTIASLQSEVLALKNLTSIATPSAPAV